MWSNCQVPQAAEEHVASGSQALLLLRRHVHVEHGLSGDGLLIDQGRNGRQLSRSPLHRIQLALLQCWRTFGFVSYSFLFLFYFRFLYMTSEGELDGLLPLHALLIQVRKLRVCGARHEPVQGACVGALVQGPFGCHQVPAATIQGQAGVLRVSSSPSLGQGHHSIRLACQVRLLDLARVRGQQDLEGLEVALGVDLALPGTLLVPPMDHNEVLVVVGRNHIGQGLERSGDATCRSKASYSRSVNTEFILTLMLHS